MLHPKKVGTLPVGHGSDEVKQTNEIKYAPLLLDELPIEGKDITSDALHTQTAVAHYLVEERKAQAYKIERQSTDKKTGEISREVAYGITSRSAEMASPKTILHKVRQHWSVEVCHYIIDWIYDEDRSTIRTGHASENMTRLRRFAIGLIKSKANKKISKKMRQMNKDTRAVLDYLKITTNVQKPCAA